MCRGDGLCFRVWRRVLAEADVARCVYAWLGLPCDEADAIQYMNQLESDRHGQETLTNKHPSCDRTPPCRTMLHES